MKNGIVLVLAASQLLTGCMTMKAVEKKKYWKVPATVPADVVLFPAELCGLAFLCYVLSGMHFK